MAHKIGPVGALPDKAGKGRYGFTVCDENGTPALTVGFASEDHADSAWRELSNALAMAVFVRAGG